MISIFCKYFLKNYLNFPSQYSTFRYQILSIKILIKKENTFYGIIKYISRRYFFYGRKRKKIPKFLHLKKLLKLYQFLMKKY